VAAGEPVDVRAESDATRRGLHAVAEQLLAGPQHRTSGTIRLRVSVDGFGTVARPEVRVEGGDVVHDGKRMKIDGATIAGLADELGLDAGAPQGVYPAGGGPRSDETLHVIDAIAAEFAEAFAVGDAALRSLAPDAEPVLWPEHFDVGVRVDGVNYGVSPGDDYLVTPYAYVGVDPVPSGPFWNAPFGAARPLIELAGIASVLAFFTDGRRAAGRQQELR
jgi:hypothetical protein